MKESRIPEPMTCPAPLRAPRKRKLSSPAILKATKKFRATREFFLSLEIEAATGAVALVVSLSAADIAATLSALPNTSVSERNPLICLVIRDSVLPARKLIQFWDCSVTRDLFSIRYQLWRNHTCPITRRFWMAAAGGRRRSPEYENKRSNPTSSVVVSSH